MLVAQLPEGAALGRTTARPRPGDKAGARHAGSRTVIAISGLSALDNLRRPANAGVSFVVLKPWDERSKKAGTDILSIADASAERARRRARRQAFRGPAAPDPGYRQCRRVADAARTARRQLRLRQAVRGRASNSSSARKRDPRLQRVLTTLRSGRAACHGNGRPRARRRRCASRSAMCSRRCRPISDRPMSTSSINSVKPSRFMRRPIRASACGPTTSNLDVRSSDNQMVPFGAVAHLGSQVGPSLVTLYNLYPSATVIGAPARGTARARRSPRWRKSRKRHCRPMSATSGPRCPTRRS